MTEFTPHEIRAALIAIADGTVSQCRELDEKGIFHFLYGRVTSMGCASALTASSLMTSR